MEIVKLLAIFLVIVIVLNRTKQLPIAVLCGALSAVFLFRLSAGDAFFVSLKAIVSPMTITTILAFYTITFLQRMLETRGHLAMAQKALNGLFNNRRINAFLAPIFIGMLPSPGAVTICGAIVDSATEDYLSVEEKTFVTSYYRHIPESFLPTYTTIIIAVQLSGVELSSFLIAMFPVVIVEIALGYYYLRKVPKDTGQLPSVNRKQDLVELIKSLWTIPLTIILIIAAGLPVYIAVLSVIVLSVIINKFNFEELKPMFVSAFEIRLILTTITIMIFKDIVIATNAINTLPELLANLPIPSFLIFCIIFFLGSIISGQSAINVVGLPLAFASIPNAGVPLLVLLMNFGFAAMQISPTHICLAIVTEYFKVSMGTLIKKTLPVIAALCLIVTGYYLLLINFT